MADRRRWLAGTGVGAVTAALLLTGLTPSALGDDTPQEPPPAPVASPGAAAPAAADPLPPMGAFTDSGPDGISGIAALESWLGGTRTRVGHTYLPGGDWAGIEGDDALLKPWADWKRAGPDRMFVLNVPMQDHNEDHVPDREVRTRIRAGAGGAYDAHFTRLARRLVALGVPDTVVVLGWEMNGTTYTHRCAPDPDGWRTYWKRIVSAMRAVPGQRFRFDFAPDRGQDAIAWTRCYPGDDTVDVIGMDSYDQPPGASFSDQVTEPYGLQAQVDFAAGHGKAISYPEWGLFRNGDNPDYMRLMLGWIIGHKPLYQTITDYCPHGVLACAENPRSSAVYRELLSAGRPQPGGSQPRGPVVRGVAARAAGRPGPRSPRGAARPEAVAQRP
ncbi:glycoside hydrolase family 26 protein [Actinacidiphila sp. ITFR-21]|uniref:glycoside hydrolase family 26 protein n=1 Tax=Actinacidiphila sp. ITFR-21 TaxID=3075199 RepID=UPI002889334C|nr:glycosyl hydrolase [Streptomyces sp. ITFR-21]WNI16490.1 glycosyl hydrolase [Streptomyces sp. ITFR-21]